MKGTGDVGRAAAGRAWAAAGPLTAVLVAIPWVVRPCGIAWDNRFHHRVALGWLDAWSHGVLWPCYIDNANAGLGSFWPYYYPPLFHVFTALGMAVGFDFWRAAILTLTAAQAVGAGLCFAWLRGRTSDPAAGVGSVAFALAPYPFLNVYLRGAFPEGLAIACLPGVFWGVDRVRDRWGWRAAAPGIASFALVTLGNLPALLVAGIATAVYAAAVSGRKPGAFVRGMGVAAVALGLTAFSWMAAWLDSGLVRVTGTDLGVNNDSPFYLRFGTLPREDVLVTGLYITAYFVAALAAVLTAAAWTGPRERRWRSVAPGVLVIGVALWFSSVAAWPAYHYTPLLHRAQFPWRFLAATSAGLALLAALAVDAAPGPRRGATVAALLAALLGFDAYIYFKNTFATDLRPDTAHGSHTLLDYLTMEGQVPPFGRPPYPKVDVVRGDVTAEAVEWRPGWRAVATRGGGPFTLRLATYVDPRWQARDQDGRPLTSDRETGGVGRLVVMAPAGTSRVTVALARTDNAVFAAWVSLLCALDVLGFALADRAVGRRAGQAVSGTGGGDADWETGAASRQRTDSIPQ